MLHGVRTLHLHPESQHAPDCCTNAKLFVRCVSITHNDSVFLRETSDVCLLVCLYRLWHQLTLELLQLVHHSCFKAGGRLEVCVYMNVQIYVCSKFHFPCGQTIEVFLCFHSFCSSTIISLLTSNQSMSHDFLYPIEWRNRVSVTTQIKDFMNYCFATYVY